MGLYDGMDIVPASAAPAAPFPKSPIAGLYDGLEVVPNAAQTVPQPREAKGFVESVQAGFQASAPGLAWRRKLPELISNPEHASWWERAATGITQVVSELPLMIGGAIAGAPVGSAAGGAMAGPPGAAAGAVLGAGFGMGAVPAAIRTSYIEALKAGEVKDAGDFWNILREAAIAAAKEGGINAAAMGAGALAGRAVGAAIAPGIGTKTTVGTATKAIETADIATQIALMPTIPAVLAGRLPAAHEFLDAAIVIGGLKAAHVTAARITQVYQRTGKTPAEQVADAQENPEVAREMAAEPEARAAVEVPRTPDGRVDMPTIQEALFAETARVDELELRARNAATPLSDAERVELEGLKSRVASLEEQLSAAAIAATRPVDAAPRFAPEQLVDARTQAEARIAELDAKAAEGALTDTERAQRVFLKNSLDKPEALAMHFKLEPAGGRVPTAEEREASAQRVYEDVLAQVRAADEARRGAGLEPLGEAHADAVAQLVRARVRTRAARMGKLPEEIYNERPLQIRDEAAADTIPAQSETKGTLGETTAEAPQGPEVDLFGEPIVPPAVDHAVAELPITQVPVAGLRLSMDVPQFKGGADANGVVVPLQGKFDPTGVGPIQVWERLNGDLEVISGRHRFDLARRDGRELINAQVHREADGFTADRAAALDAILNIRDEQGSTADYAQFFKLAGITKEAADAQGLLARAKGKAGFAIARDASDDLAAAHRAGKLSDEAALAISAAAPGSDRLQALGIMQVTEGKSILFAVNTMRAVDLMAAERMAAGAQGDIFGFDDSAMREAAAMAKKASSKQRAISEQIAAVSGASKRPELARKMGVNVDDPAGIQKKIIELKQEQYLWDNWPLYPELVAKLRDDALRQEALELGMGDMLKPNTEPYLDKAETPAEGAARDAEAAAAAMRKIENDGEPPPDTLFQSKPETWWYSALARQVDAANMKAAPAQGWKDWLKGQTGKGAIKADEIKWSGLEEWLDLQEGRVTKEAVAAYLKTGGVKVDEVMLGKEGEPNFGDARIAGDLETLRRAGWDVETPPDVDDFAYVAFRDPHGNIEDAADLRRWAAEDPSLQPIAEAANRIFDHIQSGPKDAPPTKFSQYVLPGGKNYRELLLTLPPETAEAGVARILREAGLRLEADGLNRRAVDANGQRVNALDGDADLRDPNGRDATPEEQRAIVAARAADRGRQDRPTFTSSHFDTPNILAHVRFNERTDAEGKRVLFVEEFQSDWAQKGRKEGFRGEEAMRYTVEKSVSAGGAEVWLVKDAQGNTVNYGATEAEARRWAVAMDRQDLGKIPRAPFVDKTDAWLQLAVKRMVAYAAENGFDKIAWTRGEQQVERYTSALRKAVDVIEWKKTPDGIHLVGYKGVRSLKKLPQELTDAVDQVLSRNDLLGFDSHMEARDALWADRADWASRWEVELPADRAVINEYIRRRTAMVSAREMEPHQNKVVDTTEKENALSDAIGKAMAEQIIKDPNQEGTIEGEGIKVDDTGMAGFYDRILPGVAKDVIKKLGGGKVGEAELPGTSTFEKYDITDDPATGRWILTDRETNRAVPGAPTFRTGSDAEKWVSENTSQKHQAFDITPEMREKAMQGLPLFQDPNTPRGSYQIAANLITTMQGADKSTVVHELGHSWLEEMKADAAREDAPAQIKADWDILRAELAIGADGKISRESHEQWARTVERYLAEGEAPSVELRGVFERFKAWLLEIYQSLGALKANVTPELKAVLDRMLATDEQLAAARELDVPTSYVPEAAAARAEAIVPPPSPKREIRPGLVAEAAAIKPFADELPAGPGEAPDTSRVNYAYINTPMDVKLAMQRMAELDQAEIQKQRGGTEGVKSWAEANAEQARYLNDILGGGPDTLKLFEPRDPDAPHVDVRLGILKKLAVGAAKDSARLRDIVLEKGHDATVREQLEYLGSIERARMIQAEFLGERASVARALNALKDSTEGTGEIGRMLEAIGLGDDATLMQAARTAAEEQAYLKAQLDQILLNYKGKSVLDIAKLHKEIGTLKGSFKLAKELEKASTWEMVVEAWKSALLSGPVTHTTNLFGTGAFHVMRAPVDALAAVIGMARGASPGMGESDRASMSEAVARLTGMLGGVQDGLKVAYHTFQLDDPTGKTESYRGAIPGRAGELVRIPLRLMGAEDALVSTMYKRGELRTLAIRQAFDEQLNPSTREFAERVDYLTDNPTPEMDAIATDAGTRMTFNMPLGEKGIALQLFVNKWNLQWMLPFIRTPINIFKELIRMSPFAPAIGEWRADIAKGGVARDRALAEMAIGAGVMTATMALAFSGQISGNGSPDPGKNRAKVGVWQPYSVMIGDTWYEYARIQPVGTLMGMAADMSLIWDHMTDEEKDKTPKLLAAAFANAVTNQTFLQGITNVVNATSDPVRFGPRFLQQFAGSLVPNVIGQPTAMADPVVREVNSMLEAIQSRIPGMRQDLLPKRDWLGDTVKTKERLGLIMPVREQKVSEDKVRLEADRLELSMAAAPKKTHIGKGTGKLGDVELTPQERNTFASVGGEFAHKILTNIVNAPGYDEMPDLVKRQIFAKVLTASHRVAAVAAMPPEKRMAYLESITEKVQSELQPAGQE